MSVDGGVRLESVQVDGVARSQPVAAGDPGGLNRIARVVEERLRAVFDQECRRWGDVDVRFSAPLKELEAFVLNGGKRLRPVFCHWAFVGAGGDPFDALVLDAGCALELLHSFALIHDDVMDGSPTRRGLPSIHVRYSDLHAASEWSGESRRFGDGVAILLGDLAFVYADRLLEGASLAARRVFTELRIEVNLGQYLDVVGTAERISDVKFAQEVAIYKSGKYSVERPLHLGAALAGRLDELAPSLSAYGMPLGEAFQLRDDILGVFGETSETGKPVGDDIVEGKPTLLYALTKERATSRQRLVLDELFGRPDLGSGEIKLVQDLFVDCGALDSVELRIEELVNVAVDGLDGALLLDEASESLRELALFVARRRS
ncbi:MAG: polyprenyl synthetase family protein [Acidimicrobiales bacterium]